MPIIYAVPVDEADIVAPDSTIEPCSRCERKCYVQKSARKMAPTGEVVCTHCIEGVIAERSNMLHQFMRLQP